MKNMLSVEFLGKREFGEDKKKVLERMAALGDNSAIGKALKE